MILFVDSGIGGMIYMEEFLARTNDRSCLYLADTAFFPYGEKPPEAVRDRVVSLVRAVTARYNLEAIVIACNTASVVALEAVRAIVSIPVVGTVPAVKPAAARTRTGHIAVLATSRTAEDPYTDDLVARFARVGTVSRLGLPRLVAAAEEWCTEDERRADEEVSTAGSTESARGPGHEAPPRRRAEARIEAIIREDVQSCLAGDVDTVVLACTHFVRFRNTFSRVLGSHVAVVDSLDGVTRRLMAVLGVSDGATGSSASVDTNGHHPTAAARDAVELAPRFQLLRTGATDANGGCGEEGWTIFP